MHLRNDEPCPTCGRFANRGVTIDAVIIKEGKILLIRRGVEPFKGYWGLPGGYVGWDETIDDALKRELKEELHVDVTESRQLAILSDPHRHPKQAIDIPYEVTVKGQPKAGDDAQEIKWFEINSLPKLAFDHRKIINLLLGEHVKS